MSEKKSYGTGLIILCFIFFWPLGLILLILKLSQDKSITDKILPNNNNPNNQNPIPFFRPQQPPAAKKTEICSGCGAPNLVTPGTVTVCEYCGKRLT